MSLVSSGPSLTLEDNFNHGKAYGEIKGGIDVLSLGVGWSGFANVGVKFNSEFTTLTGKGGVSYNW